MTLSQGQALRLAKEAVNNRYQAERLFRSVHPQAGEYDSDIEDAMALVGLAFHAGWQSACECCRPKMWAYFEAVRAEMCTCGCGNTMDKTITGIWKTLKEPEPPDMSDSILIGRIALQFRYEADEPVFRTTLRTGLRCLEWIGGEARAVIRIQEAR